MCKSQWCRRKKWTWRENWQQVRSIARWVQTKYLKTIKHLLLTKVSHNHSTFKLLTPSPTQSQTSSPPPDPGKFWKFQSTSLKVSPVKLLMSLLTSESSSTACSKRKLPLTLLPKILLKNPISNPKLTGLLHAKTLWGRQVPGLEKTTEKPSWSKTQSKSCLDSWGYQAQTSEINSKTSCSSPRCQSLHRRLLWTRLEATSGVDLLRISFREESKGKTSTLPSKHRNPSRATVGWTSTQKHFKSPTKKNEMNSTQECTTGKWSRSWTKWCSGACQSKWQSTTWQTVCSSWDTWVTWTTQRVQP